MKAFISDTFTSFSLHRQRTPARPIARARVIAPTRDGGEGFAPKAFTPICMDHNILRHTGDGVKAKNENRLMRAREKPSKK